MSPLSTTLLLIGAWVVCQGFVIALGVAASAADRRLERLLDQRGRERHYYRAGDSAAAER